VGFAASTAARVQELLDAEPASVSGDGAAWDGAADALPLRAFARIITSELIGPGGARAQSISEFFDPQRLEQPNPEEFGLEVAAFANLASAAYVVTGEGVERRVLLFTSPGSNPDLPAEIRFDADGTAKLESRVYLSGAVLIWSLNAEADLTGVSADVQVTIRAEGQAASVFDAGLTLTGGEAARVQVQVDQPIQFELGGVELLSADMDTDSGETLPAGLEDVGTVVVVLIPPQEHAYQYTVTADEPLTLAAEFALEVRNAPGGTGVAAVLGRPFDSLANFIETALPQVDGEGVQGALNKANADRAVDSPAADDPSTAGGRSPTRGQALCGLFGTELALGLAAFGVLHASRSRRPA